MKPSVAKQPHTFAHFLVYALGFLLIWEWLRPIPIVTYTGEIHVFILFALFAFLLTFLRIPYYATVPLLFLGSLYGHHYIFGEGRFIERDGGGESVRTFFSDFSHNLGLIFSWELQALTDPFRSFLFFLLLGLVAYLMYYWIFYIKKIFFFLFITIVYITVLDTFTPLDASMAIVRIVVIGFFLVTMLHMLTVQAKEREIGRRSASYMSTAWLYTLMVMILGAASVGYAAPKFEPQWRDPVPTLERWVMGESSGSGQSVRRVGYGDNDERLGGGFIQDDNPVFYADVEQPGYWRGESKDEYTGHGWVISPDYVDAGDDISYSLYASGVSTESYTARLEMEDGVGFSNIFYPGQLTSLEVNEMANADGTPTFQIERIGGEVRIADSDTLLLDYQLDYDFPSFNTTALESASEEEDSEAIQERYLQLPDDLPDRVGDLAEDIVSDYDNRYDKALAIEQYFGSNDFVYDTDDIPVPDEGQDYVDQFLFDTQRGYCDNFSTSMVVLLRSVDIPARWVKGFTEGESVETLDGGSERYEVTNGNAHSWVEVYFPEVGWVPFEPTQGFSTNVDFSEEAPDQEETVVEEEEEDAQEEPNAPEQDEDLFPEDDEFGEAGAASGGSDGGGLFSTDEWVTPKTVIISLVVLVMVMVLYEKKHRLLSHYFLLHYKLTGKNKAFTTAYERALWLLDNEGIPRAEGETLREYANRVDHITGTTAMGRLTSTYEQVCYGGRSTGTEWTEEQKHWEELVNALKS
ncbi:transglutaminase TgpA family protein [Alteribacter aurantiacus]|uniref:transglutaminase TgpA family protein n=1 Tax=Alteribacter aurantiacus TaxID=254410 RepID=UPI0003F5AD99|nr:transglutaminaseTgpA domain-containing protein [Alteribacter aurantiacus]